MENGGRTDEGEGGTKSEWLRLLDREGSGHLIAVFENDVFECFLGFFVQSSEHFSFVSGSWNQLTGDFTIRVLV